ncbi:MAG: hypothetical protein AB8I08_32475 [Sandaracinaceae bacterium]
MPRHPVTARLPVLILALLVGCVAAPTVTALNPLTGETRQYDVEADVPAGWIVCADAESCPAPRACDGLGEASCLTRPDCSPTYSGAALPRECETDGPRPAICDDDLFAGCTEAAATCDEAACGPTPLGATYLCDDGSAGGITGRCVLGEEGECGWETRACPAPRPEECAPADCGRAPASPSYECADGSAGGNTGVCLRHDDGSCGWEVRTCPVADCAAEECGPAPLAPSYLCGDGSAGGNLGVCERRDGVCGWAFRVCPDAPASDCSEAECGPPSRAPLFECWDGSLGGNIGVCDRDDAGTCGWVFRTCPPEPCPAVACDLECPAGTVHPVGAGGCEDTCACEPLPCSEAECGPPSGAPMFACGDGSWGGNLSLCERDREGTCAWVFRECPPDACPDEACGAPSSSPRLECGDGSVGGNTGRCLQGARGACSWEERACPDACTDVPHCRLACPPGTHTPTDEDGCLRTCECEPDR